MTVSAGNSSHSSTAEIINEVSQNTTVQEILSALFENNEFRQYWELANHELADTLKIQVVPHDKCLELGIADAKIVQVTINNETFRQIKIDENILSDTSSLARAVLNICFEIVNATNLSRLKLLNKQVRKGNLSESEYITKIQSMELNALAPARNIAASVFPDAKLCIDENLVKTFISNPNSRGAQKHSEQISKNYQVLRK